MYGTGHLYPILLMVELLLFEMNIKIDLTKGVFLYL